MKRIAAFFLIISFILWQGAALGVVKEPEAGEMPRYMPGQVIVKLKEGKTLDDLKELNTRYGLVSSELVFKDWAGKEDKTLSLNRIYLLKVAADAEIPAAVAAYQGHPAVEYAEPNYMVEIQSGTLKEVTP